MRYRVVNKKRFTAFLTVCMLSLVMLISPVFFRSYAESAAEKHYITVTVETGDTLWGIAKKYGPDNKDIRRTVHEICRVNTLTESLIQPGDMLLVPAE